MALSLATGRNVRILESGFRQLTRGRLSPIGRDLERRALRITRQMKQNATGRPGPNIQTRNLYEAISFLRVGETSRGMYADVGPQPHRLIRRGYNYALLLELGHGSTPAYPFMERALDAARE